MISTLEKDMTQSQISLLLDDERSIMGDGGTTSDWGEHSEISCIEVVVHLENLIFTKFPDTSSPNYKTLSKKII